MVRPWWAIAFVMLSACAPTAPPPIDDTGVAASCPTHLDLELIGSQSRFDPGASGNAHGVGLANGSEVTVELFDCDDECRRCRFRGPVRGNPALTPIITQRCLDDLPTTCTSDADCGGGMCRFVFPPISSITVGNDTCSLAYFEPVSGPDPSPIQGVTDLFTGEADMPIMNIHIESKIGVKCTDCIDDQTPFDGIRDGTCAGSATTCDINGLGTIVASKTSYDCPPPPDGLVIPLPGNGTSTASRIWTFDNAERPPCSNGGAFTPGERCWCSMCTDGKTPCAANRDCPAGRTCGFAGTSMAPVNASNNSCSKMGETCTWNATTMRGECSQTPGRSCYPDGVAGTTMIATGTAEMGDGFFITQFANLVCLPAFDPSTGFGVLLNAITGFPGPFLFQARFRATPRTETAR